MFARGLILVNKDLFKQNISSEDFLSMDNRGGEEKHEFSKIAKNLLLSFSGPEN